MKYAQAIGAMLLSVAFGNLQAQQASPMNFEVDLSQNLDTLYVTLQLDEQLEKDQEIYQFAATAPGTYQTMNIGRFVSDFQVFDKKGKPLDFEQKSVNQYVLDKPQKAAKITYAVAETFDTKVSELPIYLMCGSSIEKDHILLNAHTFLGYFEGEQATPINLKLNYSNADWVVGTALMKDSAGNFTAESYDHIVDSPILLGNLTEADTLLGETPIKIFTYSESGEINSRMLLTHMADMLGASQQFLVKLPVDRYTFLYYFAPKQPGTTGAWEHSYSSEYVLYEEKPSEEFLQKVTDIASHEFFHIVTPLNIHSEIVEQFNFESPTPSVHLWMYEGVTEWASNILLYRAGVVSLEDYLKNSVEQKIKVDNKYFDSTWSLKRIADESFTTGAAQYGNVYYRGSLVAGLLDIRLLELSGGTYGLRELMLDLVDKYGKGNPVSEATFFDDITAMTYPEIRSFFDAYVLDAQPLPLTEYFAKIGIKVKEGRKGVKVEMMKSLSPEQQKLFDAWSKNLPRN